MSGWSLVLPIILFIAILVALLWVGARALKKMSEDSMKKYILSGGMGAIASTLASLLLSLIITPLLPIGRAVVPEDTFSGFPRMFITFFVGLSLIGFIPGTLLGIMLCQKGEKNEHK